MDAGDPGPLRGGGAQRVAAVQVVGAVRRHDPDRAAEAPGEQEGEQVARRPVGPVDVLDDEQQRPVGHEVLQRGVQRLEEVGPVEGVGRVGVPAGGPGAAGEQPAAGLQVGQRRVGLRQPGGDLRVVGGQPAEDLGEREVGQRAVAEVEAVAHQGAPAGVGRAVDELGEQPGLADAGVTAEQHERGARHAASSSPAGRPSRSASRSSSCSRPCSGCIVSVTGAMASIMVETTDSAGGDAGRAAAVLADHVDGRDWTASALTPATAGAAAGAAGAASGGGAPGAGAGRAGRSRSPGASR